MQLKRNPYLRKYCLFSYSLIFCIFIGTTTITKGQSSSHTPKTDEKNTEQSLLSDTSKLGIQIVSFWESYCNAIKEKNFEYLIANSQDSIECGICDWGDNPKKWNDPRLVFIKYLYDIYDSNILSNKDFELARQEDNYYINYTILDDTAPEGAYNIVYTIKQLEKQLKFVGVFSVL